MTSTLNMYLIEPRSLNCSSAGKIQRKQSM